MRVFGGEGESHRRLLFMYNTIVQKAWVLSLQADRFFVLLHRISMEETVLPVIAPHDHPEWAFHGELLGAF